MKKTIIASIIVLAVVLLSVKTVQAQGTIYLSNLGQPSTGTEPVGSDSWCAAQFVTGHGTDGNFPGPIINGYVIDSIQLQIADAIGDPTNLTVMIYSQAAAGGPIPGSSLATLTGSSDPSTAGIYTYTPSSSLILSPDTAYFIVITAGTAIADGAYEWSVASPASYNPNGGWSGGLTFNSNNNGSSWSFNGGGTQFAITATPIPEPSPSWLLLLGGGVFFYVRRIFQR